MTNAHSVHEAASLLLRALQDGRVTACLADSKKPLPTTWWHDKTVDMLLSDSSPLAAGNFRFNPDELIRVFPVTKD